MAGHPLLKIHHVRTILLLPLSLLLLLSFPNGVEEHDLILLKCTELVGELRFLFPFFLLRYLTRYQPQHEQGYRSGRTLLAASF